MPELDAPQGTAQAHALRTMLYVPADRPSMVEKARGIDVDAVILDLEDAVAPENKDAARSACLTASCDWPAPGPELWVRVNDPQTENGRADLQALLEQGIRHLVVPKIDRDSARSCAALLEEARAPTTRVIGLVETARGLIDAPTLAEVLPPLVGLQFGAEDFTADMGIERTADGEEIHFARSSLAVAARAQGLASVDTPLTEFRELEPVRRDARTARALGFTGKACIHPAQIPAVLEAFTPTPGEIAEARRIVDALAAASSAGHGTASVGGRMLDAPIAQRARAVLARAGNHETVHHQKGTH